MVTAPPRGWGFDGAERNPALFKGLVRYVQAAALAHCNHSGVPMTPDDMVRMCSFVLRPLTRMAEGPTDERGAFFELPKDDAREWRGSAPCTQPARSGH